MSHTPDNTDATAAQKKVEPAEEQTAKDAQAGAASKLHEDVHNYVHLLHTGDFKTATTKYNDLKDGIAKANKSDSLGKDFGTLELIHEVNSQQNRVAKTVDDIRFVGNHKDGDHTYDVYTNDRSSKNHQVFFKDDKGFHTVSVDTSKDDTDEKRFSNISTTAFKTMEDASKSLGDKKNTGTNDNNGTTHVTGGKFSWDTTGVKVPGTEKTITTGVDINGPKAKLSLEHEDGMPQGVFRTKGGSDLYQVKADANSVSYGKIDKADAQPKSITNIDKSGITTVTENGVVKSRDNQGTDAVIPWTAETNKDGKISKLTLTKDDKSQEFHMYSDASTVKLDSSKPALHNVSIYNGPNDSLYYLNPSVDGTTMQVIRIKMASDYSAYIPVKSVTYTTDGKAPTALDIDKENDEWFSN